MDDSTKENGIIDGVVVGNKVLPMHRLTNSSQIQHTLEDLTGKIEVNDPGKNYKISLQSSVQQINQTQANTRKVFTSKALNDDLNYIDLANVTVKASIDQMPKRSIDELGNSLSSKCDSAILEHNIYPIIVKRKEMSIPKYTNTDIK